MSQYSKAGLSDSGSAKSTDDISEEEAMVAFSSAKLNGVKIMELPDQNP